MLRRIRRLIDVPAVPRPPAQPHPELWLVRHGETEWARSGRHTGLTDIPLTARGREQAVVLAPRLVGHAFARVISSPLSRAFDTAQLAGFGDRVETDSDLVEWDYGDDEGRTSAAIRSSRPGWTIWTRGPKGGETIDAVATRVDRVIATARQIKGTTLVFAHGHLLRILASRWIGLPPNDGSRFALDTATISILGWDRDTPVIRRWNDGLDHT